MLASFAAQWTADHPAAAIVAGLVLLVVGADVLVRGAVWIALTVGISRMSVGLTLVAMGTSMPELIVSVTAARQGYSNIALANVLGSNVCNILLIVGFSAAIRAIKLRTNWLELSYMLVATALAGIPFLLGTGVDRQIAAAMLVMLVIFCAHLLHRERTSVKSPEHHSRPRATMLGWLVHVVYVAFGLALLVYGAEWLVEGAVTVARSFGISDAIVGMTIVAVGTSLPELATSAVAALRGQPEIAVGNVVGSNIFNVGAVLGIAGLLQPFPVDVSALGRLMIATAASAILLVVALRTCWGVPRLVGLFFLVAYAGYLTSEVLLSRA